MMVVMPKETPDWTEHDLEICEESNRRVRDGTMTYRRIRQSFEGTAMKGIIYRDTFDAFRETLSESERKALDEELIEFVNGNLNITPRHCKKIPNQDKLAFETAVVFYTINGNDMEFIGGCTYPKRASQIFMSTNYLNIYNKPKSSQN